MTINCSGCGRDVTVNRKQYDPRAPHYCRRCQGRQTQISDEKGRHHRHPSVLAGTIDNDRFDDESGPEDEPT